MFPSEDGDAWQKILPADQRMDFISIVTPNHMHFPPAKMALENGFHVLSDKPATFNLAEAKELAKLVKKTGRLYGLTHNYTGYPLVKQARDMVATGKLGKIRKVVVEYPQGWLATRLEASDQKQAAWRTDPKRSGAAGCIGDIGTHAENLAEYISGLHIEELAADITAFVKGRALDDDGNVFDNVEQAHAALSAEKADLDRRLAETEKNFADARARATEEHTALTARLGETTGKLQTTERTLEEIGEALAAEHGARVAIVHRVGHLLPGEAAVVIAAAAPHRAPAFRACEAAIERLVPGDHLLAADGRDAATDPGSEPPRRPRMGPRHRRPPDVAAAAADARAVAVDATRPARRARRSKSRRTRQ